MNQNKDSIIHHRKLLIQTSSILAQTEKGCSILIQNNIAKLLSGSLSIDGHFVEIGILVKLSATELGRAQIRDECGNDAIVTILDNFITCNPNPPEEVKRALALLMELASGTRRFGLLANPW